MTFFSLAIVLGSVTVTHVCGLQRIADSNDTLMDILCSKSEQLNNNTTVLLPAPLYTIPADNSCLIVNIVDLTIQGNDSNSWAVIRCLPSKDKVGSCGFTLIGVHWLNITYIVFENCGGPIPERVLQFGRSSLFHFDQGELAVLTFVNCSSLNLANVKITKYFGRAFIGVDITGHSVVNSVTVSENIAMEPVHYVNSAFNPGSRGSGIVWMYTNSTMDSANTIISIVNSEFSDNIGYTEVPNIDSFVCGDLLADAFYSMDITGSSMRVEPVNIPSAGALSLILQQHSLVQANIINSRFLNNRGLCYGAILVIYLGESAYNSLKFSECEFTDNGQILSNFTHLSGKYFGSTLTLLIKHMGSRNGGTDCLSMTDSQFTNDHAIFNASCIVLTEFPSSSGACLAVFRNITGGNIRLLYAVSLETYGSSLFVNLSDIRLTGKEVLEQLKLDVADGLLTFSYVSKVVIHGSSDVGSSFSMVSGPVISAEVSNVIFTGKVSFSNIIGSSWTSGAALNFRGEAKIWFMEPLNLIFSNNSALEGGAIYSVSRFGEYCAFQFMTDSNRVYNSSNIHDMAINVTFISNHARLAGNSVYASPLYQCSNRLSPTVKADPDTIYKAIFHFIDSVNSGNGLLEMSSKPLRVCLCGDVPNNTTELALDCDAAEEIKTYPGKTFYLSVIAVDEAFQRVYSIIYNNLQQDENAKYNGSTPNWHLGNGEDIVQVNGYSCTALNFTIYSDKAAINGHIITSASESTTSLSIPIYLQNCPPGFELVYNRCDCVQLLRAKGIECNISSGTVTRPGTAWIGIASEHTNESDHKSVVVGYSNHCPTRYCNEKASVVNVSDPSSLCVHNRMGVLCGQCEVGLSVAVGGPQCLRCSHLWLFTIPLYAFLCFVYVALLLLLQMTIAKGTINGLIFYANLLNVNTYTLLSGYSGSRWALSFIAFLNIELGFPVCLYNGLDELNKALLSIVLPTYIWLLAMVFVYASRYSRQLSTLTSQSAVPLLATMIHISYLKLLRFSVDGFAFGTIELQSNMPSRKVWYYDGSIAYLHDSRHIVLFLMVVVVTCLFIIPYGVILTGIKYFSRFRIVIKFKPLIDAYCSPFKDKYRFWFGSRLWVLLIHYILFAILRNNPLEFLLCQGVILTLFTLAQVAIMPFRNKILNVLDLFFMVNTLLLTIVSLYTNLRYPTYQNVASAVSVGLTVVVYCGIVCYHAGTLIKLVITQCRKIGKYAILEETGFKTETVVTTSSLIISSTGDPVSIQKHAYQEKVRQSKFRDSILADSVADQGDN